MADNSRPPVAIRIVRPFDTEDALLDNELETIGKTSIVLIGAHPRPTGVILRFEVTLATGATVLRGEGRVLAHKENAFRGQPGLTLRFTRLDPKSKAIVDRATAMREGRSTEGGTPSHPVPRPESPIAEALTQPTPTPAKAAPNVPAIVSIAEQEAQVARERAAARERANAAARENAKRTGRGLTPPLPPFRANDTRATQTGEVDQRDEAHPDEVATAVPGEVATGGPGEAATAVPGEVATGGPGEVAESARVQRSAPAPPAPIPTPTPRLSRSEGGPRSPETPPNREELLARLRHRAGTLPPERVEEILAARATR